MTMTTTDVPELKPLELDALCGCLRAHDSFGDRGLQAALAELRQVDEAGEQVKARLLEAGRVNSAREELRKVTARYAEGHATVAQVQVAHAEVRRAEKAERAAADALVAHEARRQAACAEVCTRVVAAVRPHAEAARAKLAGAVKKAIVTAEAAADAQEELFTLVNEVGRTFDYTETPWLPGIGSACTKLGVPRCRVREAERVIRHDLRAAPQAYVGGGRHCAWQAEARQILKQLE